MKKIVVLLMLFLMIATPLYALNILEKLLYREVRLGGESVLVNKATKKVEKKLVNNKYELISSEKGWGGIPSEQDMYQARYDRNLR
ncbi:MAG: hypothetical protein Q8O01_07840 [Candidatus Omnitrophota bacterium]|nr:hypothetical protein [Candidatus Omnitrophota bacterium]